MRDDEAGRIGSDCVRDSEIADIERDVAAADPGAWRAGRGQLERYGGKPFERPEASLHLASRAVTVIPRLLRGIRVLEERYAQARAEIASLKNELTGERTAGRAAALPRAEGRTGPEWEPAQIIRMAELWAALPAQERFPNATLGDAIRTYFLRWLGGETVGQDVRSSTERLERRLAEHHRFSEKWEAEQKASIERSRDTLRGWIERLEAGEVPDDLARQWVRKTKAERTAYLKDKRAAEAR